MESHETEKSELFVIFMSDCHSDIDLLSLTSSPSSLLHSLAVSISSLRIYVSCASLVRLVTCAGKRRKLLFALIMVQCPGDLGCNARIAVQARRLARERCRCFIHLLSGPEVV